MNNATDTPKMNNVENTKNNEKIAMVISTVILYFIIDPFFGPEFVDTAWEITTDLKKSEVLSHSVSAIESVVESSVCFIKLYSEQIPNDT